MRIHHHSRRGFSMAEVALALGVVSFAFVSIISILPLGLNDTRNAVAGTGASCVLAAISADLLAAPATAPQTSRYQIAFPSATSIEAGSQMTLYAMETGSHRDPEGVVLSGPGKAKYRAVIRFQPRLANQNTSIPVRISISWPAAAPDANASSLETLISLNR